MQCSITRYKKCIARLDPNHLCELPSSKACRTNIQKPPNRSWCGWEQLSTSNHPLCGFSSTKYHFEFSWIPLRRYGEMPLGSAWLSQIQDKWHRYQQQLWPTSSGCPTPGHWTWVEDRFSYGWNNSHWNVVCHVWRTIVIPASSRFAAPLWKECLIYNCIFHDFTFDSTGNPSLKETSSNKLLLFSN